MHNLELKVINNIYRYHTKQLPGSLIAVTHYKQLSKAQSSFNEAGYVYTMYKKTEKKHKNGLP